MSSVLAHFPRRNGCESIDYKLANSSHPKIFSTNKRIKISSQFIFGPTTLSHSFNLTHIQKILELSSQRILSIAISTTSACTT